MELVSGPDVGGGHLLQLSRDPGDPLDRFTVHAQEGGIDGGDAPGASPAAIGFSPVRVPCSLGGRHCFHREYAAPSGDLPKVRFAYNRLRFTLGTMLRQATRLQPVPFARGLEATLERIVDPLTRAHVPWLVGGSAAPAILGARIDPHDLDLATTREGVHLIAEALADQLIDPEGQDVGEAPPARWGARAFVGTFQDGLLVEWAEAIPDREARGPHRFAWSEERLRTPVSAGVGRWTVPVAPPEVAVVSSLLRGPAARLPALRPLFADRPPSRPLLETLLTAAGATPADRERLAALLPDGGSRDGPAAPSGPARS